MAPLLLQSGQLNEYTERKEMSAEVVCMSLGSVPPGEQRSRFLAVGLADQTVRIISLDPSVSGEVKGGKEGEECTLQWGLWCVCV